MATKYETFIAKKRREYGDKFDDSHLYKALIPYFNSGQRVKVSWYNEPPMTGTIGVTTGWRPAFLLMRTSRSMGSSITLEPGSVRVVAVQRGRSYLPVVGGQRTASRRRSSPPRSGGMTLAAPW